METWGMIYYKLGNMVTGWILCLVQMAVFGAVLTGIWYLMKKRWIKNSDAHFVYTSLRAILVFFAVPVIYIGHLLYNTFNAHSGSLGDTTGTLIVVCLLLGVLWMSGSIYMCWKYHTENLKFKQICALHCPADRETAEILDHVCAMMHIRRKIRLYILPASYTPFICGIWHPTIYLPMRPYHQEELEVILTHECMHYLQRDSLWKKIVIMLRVVLWFCPLIHKLSGQLQTWCEYSCDSKCCKQYKPKNYFSLLYELADRSRQQNCSMASYLTEPETKLGERIEYMKREKSFRKRAGIAVAAATASFVFCGISGMVLVDAAMDTGYEMVYNATLEEEQAEEDVEYERNLTLEEQQYIEEVEDASGEDMDLASLGMVNYKWTIAANAGKKTKTFQVKKGDLISIKAVPSILNKKMQIGIVKPNGRFRYVVATDKKICGFKAEESGEYRVLIKNCSNVTLTVSGFYSVD